jgi:DNA-binding response OmpR family regulator
VGPELAGKRVLIAEDEFFIADDLALAVTRLGAEVMGPARNVRVARELLERGPMPDLAILDINLQGSASFELADLMRERGVRFVFATGYDKSIIPERHRGVPQWEKPFDADKLAAALS